MAMKKALIAGAAVVVLIVVALIALPMLIPAEKIKAQLVEQVKTATGRDLTIDGKMSASAFPSLGLHVGNVALSSPPGFLAKDLVRLGGLDVKLKLMPLLSGQVEVDSFVLVDPTITLEVDRQGRANWAFDSKPADPKAKAAADKDGGAAPISDIRLGDVRIVNGKLTYTDAKAGTTETVEAINLQVMLPSLDQPLAVKGGLKWHGQAITLGADLGKPRALVEAKGSTSAAVTVGADPLKLSFTGDLNGADKSVAGILDLAVPSVRNLAQWATGKPLDMPGNGLGPLSIKGKLAAAGSRVSFTQAALALDAIKASGDFAVDGGGAKPAIKATLDVDTLDLNPYLPPEGTAEAKPAKAAGKQDWSDDPIDASGLKAAEADMTLTVGAIKVRKIQVGKSRLVIALHGGKLAADLTELALYQGRGKGRLALDGSQPGVGVDASFSLAGLQAEPFLADAAAFDRLTGTGKVDIQVAGRGRSQRQIVSSLGGKGGVAFTDGAIKGINLAEMVRNVGSAFTNTGGAQKTDFSELAGTFTIASGVVSNQDLALKSPLLRVAGAGTVDLPKRAMNYRIDPKAAATVQGQGGKSDVAGIEVPVIIEGPWDNLTYRPDLAAMVKGQAEQKVKGLIEKAVPGATNTPLPLPINPGGLFGR
jgi:AsmA protein